MLSDRGSSEEIGGNASRVATSREACAARSRAEVGREGARPVPDGDAGHGAGGARPGRRFPGSRETPPREHWPRPSSGRWTGPAAVRAPGSATATLRPTSTWGPPMTVVSRPRRGRDTSPVAAGCWPRVRGGAWAGSIRGRVRPISAGAVRFVRSPWLPFTESDGGVANVSRWSVHVQPEGQGGQAGREVAGVASGQSDGGHIGTPLRSVSAGVRSSRLRRLRVGTLVACARRTWQSCREVQ